MAGRKGQGRAHLRLNKGEKPHLPKKVTVHSSHTSPSARVKHGRTHLVKERGAFK